MSDIALFLQNAWRLIWKSKLLWFFSALYSVGAFPGFQRSQNNPVWSLIALSVSIGAVILTSVSPTGITYVSFCVATGVTTDIADTWTAIKKYIGRRLAITCLIGLTFIPSICLIVLITPPASITPSTILNATLISGYVLTVFNPIWAFTGAGVIVMNFGVKKSLQNGLSIFWQHFWTLSIMSVFFTVMLWSANLLAVISILLMQTKFDFSILSRVNYLIPGMTLINTPLRGVTGIIQLISFPLSDMAYMLAYLKYKGIKTVSPSKVF